VALSLDGRTVAIGAPFHDGINGIHSGQAIVFSCSISANDWIKLGSNFDGEVRDDRSGWSVAVSSDGHTIAIGAYRNDGIYDA
jgi:hypothetical protein